ncbi:N-acetyltransferase family protein [Streptomyces sp. NPDC055189]
MTVEIRHYTAQQLPGIRQLLSEIHVEVRLHDFGLTSEFNKAERFDQRLRSYSARPGFTAVVGFEDDQAVGFAFGLTLAADTRWWSSMTTPLPGGFTDEDGTRTAALNEIVVRKPWRGRGIAWQIHQEWLAKRTEQRVTLLVNPQAGDGAVQAVYEAWGYRTVGHQQPFPDSPHYAAMIRPLT